MIPLKDIGVRMIQKSVRNYFPMPLSPNGRRTPINQWSITFGVPGTEAKYQAHFTQYMRPEYDRWRNMSMELRFPWATALELDKLNDCEFGIFVFKKTDGNKYRRLLKLRSSDKNS